MTKPIWDWEISVMSVLLCSVFVLLMITSLTWGYYAYEVVDQDEYGVVTQYNGDVVRTVESGDHFIVPVVQEMNYIQKQETVTGTVTAVSHEGVRINITYRSNLTVSKTEAGEFHRRYGQEHIKDRYTDPCTRASLRSESSNHNVSVLYDDYKPLENATRNCEVGQMEITVIDVQLPPGTEKAIEQKKQAMEQIQQAKNRTETPA